MRNATWRRWARSAQGEQVGAQSGLLIGQTEFAAQIVAVDLDGFGRDAEDICDFLGAFALHD